MSSHVHLVNFLFSWHSVAVTHTFNEYMPDMCQPLRYFSLLKLIFLSGDDPLKRSFQTSLNMMFGVVL